jgi:hypothetical protein
MQKVFCHRRKCGGNLIASVSRVVFVWWELYGGGLTLVWCLGSALIGRVVARRTSAVLVLVLIAAQSPLILWWGVPIALHTGARYGVAPRHPLNFWVIATVVLVGMPLLTLIAGLRITPQRQRSESLGPHPDAE